MVRHIVLWNFKDGLSTEEKKEYAQVVKKKLEPLCDMVQGAVSVQVMANPLPSSNREIMLDSLFENKQALDAYQTHPDHITASGLLGTFLQERTCIDYEE